LFDVGTIAMVDENIVRKDLAAVSIKREPDKTRCVIEAQRLEQGRAARQGLSPYRHRRMVCFQS
jgi:hypothetical protein